MQTQNINNKLSQYLNGEMSEEEKREFLSYAKNDPFLSDAIEGYTNTGAQPEDLSQIENQIISKKPRKILKLTVALSVAASLILIAMYFISDFNLNNTSPAEKYVYRFSERALSRVVDTNRIESRIVDEEKLRSYTAEIRVMPNNVNVPESIAPLYEVRNLTVEIDHPEYDIANKYKYRSNHFYSYLGDYKVVDYRYDNRSVNNHDILSNSNVFKSERNILVPAAEMTYVDFLQLALDKYEDGAYIDALADFSTIMDQYPDDDNAKFYKAMCYYNLGENDKSLALFEETKESQINTFHEEATWYTGLILKEERQFAAAEKVLQEIVDDNGYYGVQAKKELDELYKLYLNE